jgi:putative oxygen-independent coproporphyrinogen III oxidase
MNIAELPGLYIHIPFCLTKCPYCDFFSATDLSLIPAFLEALDQESRLYRDSFAPFDTLYLGGGTPSLLDPASIEALMKILGRTFTFAPDTEITLEANPDDVTPAKLSLWRDLGVNRLSLGVQSFADEDLRFLGRRHTARKALQALAGARAAGFSNLSLDLMYALPGQTPEAWRRTLEQALEFNPEHLSCYQLTLEAGTPLRDLQAAGRFQPAGEDLERSLLLLTSRFLAGRGYLHYEISNFARSPDRRSRHNRKYWRHVPYLGLGPSAHSFQHGVRWWNFPSVAQYCAALNAGGAPVAGRETLTPDQIRLETLYLGFRTQDGLSLETLLAPTRGPAALAELQRRRLVKVARGRVIPTRRGFLVANRLPLQFLD